MRRYPCANASWGRAICKAPPQASAFGDRGRRPNDHNGVASGGGGLCLSGELEGSLLRSSPQNRTSDEIVRIRGQEAIEIVGGEFVPYLPNALPLRHVNEGEKQQRFKRCPRHCRLGFLHQGCALLRPWPVDARALGFIFRRAELHQRSF